MGLIDAIRAVAPGRYAVGVSGGADSVALLHALHHRRSDLGLHIVHLDHQLRGEASAGDAAFVQQLAEQWKIPCTIAQRHGIEPAMPNLSANPSARYRALRHELFRRVVQEQGLVGVLLAHHADDQAETILHRLLRRSSIGGLEGMADRTQIGGLVLIRPLLGVRREEIRAYLEHVRQAWREDASNASDDYLRNRLRQVLRNMEPRSAAEAHPTEVILAFGRAMGRLHAWTEAHAPTLGEAFAAAIVTPLPRFIAHQALRVWLRDQGVGADQITAAVVDRLLALCTDAAAPPRQDFPGRLRVSRRRGVITASR